MQIYLNLCLFPFLLFLFFSFFYLCLFFLSSLLIAFFLVLTPLGLIVFLFFKFSIAFFITFSMGRPFLFVMAYLRNMSHSLITLFNNFPYHKNLHILFLKLINQAFSKVGLGIPNYSYILYFSAIFKKFI